MATTLFGSSPIPCSKFSLFGLRLLISSRLANIIATKSRQSRKPMVVFSLYGPFTDQHLLEFHDRGVAAFGSMFRTVEALLALRDRKMFIDKRRLHHT